MDGENNGKAVLKWMIWGYHSFWKHKNMELWFRRFSSFAKGMIFFWVKPFAVKFSGVFVWKVSSLGRG